MKMTVGKRRLILLALAGGMAAGAALLVNAYIKEKIVEIEARYAAGPTEQIAIVVPKTDVPAGSKVTRTTFAIRKIPTDMAPPDAVRPQDIERAEGQRLKVGLPIGRPLLWGYLSSGTKPSFSDMLEEQRRALTIAVDELNSISGMIRAYDRIDLFIVGEDKRYGKDDKRGREKMVMPLLQDVLVKATGNIVRRETGLDGKEYDRRYSTLTLDLLPAEIGRVLIAQEKGALKVVLKRPEQDHAEYSLIHESDLWARGAESEDAAPDAASINAYIGGKGTGILEAKKLLIPDEDAMFGDDFAQEAFVSFPETARESPPPEEPRAEEQQRMEEQARAAREAASLSPQAAAPRIININAATAGHGTQ
ncbi:MAG: Flp pilus assembly protein CpaB [Candidatus Accumulibacter sp.]|jgi:pilus assembly protein CpaB|nr:Flp pilus assembly protein CpaB [Accumulibacter sp.]